MPELPEVETLRRGLERVIPGQRIAGVAVSNPKVLKGQSEDVFRERVVGSSVQRVDRRGKYLLIPLVTPVSPDAPSTFLCIHLKMRGQLLLKDASASVDAYHCVTLMLEGNREVRFHDMWTWGEMRALNSEELSGVSALAKMGAEPLDPAWNEGTLAAAIAGRKTAIKPTLLDQQVVAGVGNIYADEALFRAGLHPQRPAGTLSPGEVERLANAVRAVLREAVDGGGTTSEDYVDVEGLAGRYIPRVYDRGGESCFTCGIALTRIRLGGRGTVFCSQCQS